MTENKISFEIRGAIFKIYNKLGPGLLESTYESAMKFELEKAGFFVDNQVALPFIYEEMKLDVGYRIDLLIEKRLSLK